MTARVTKAYAPATLANLAVGFDCLGIALRPEGGELWGDVVTVADREEPGDDLGLTLTGPFASHLPPDPESNLVYSVGKELLAREGRTAEAGRFELTLDKGLPIGSGLGSSSASSVATVLALSRHLGRRGSREELLPLAAFGEGKASGAEHLDNVAPALLGGLCLVRGEGEVVRLDWPSRFPLVLVTPETSIATRDAREALPATVTVPEMTGAVRNMAGFLVALRREDPELLRRCLRDEVVEPRRKKLLPGFDAVQAAAREAGALGCSFSGSGPTMFAVAPDANLAPKIADAMSEAFTGAGLASSARVASVDLEGARILGGEERA